MPASDLWCHDHNCIAAPSSRRLQHQRPCRSARCTAPGGGWWEQGQLIPFIGPVIAGGIMVALANSPTSALLVLGFVIALQQLENNLLVPNIMRSQTAVSPLLVIVAIFAGSSVGGVLGALVAVPLSAALRVLACQVLAPAVRRRTGAAAAPAPPT